MNTEVAKALDLVMDNLNEDGYLISTDEELLSVPGMTRETLDNALRIIRRHLPPGVAQRNLRDCLLDQLQFQQDRAQLVRLCGKIVALRVSDGRVVELLEVLDDATSIVDKHLNKLERVDEIANELGRPVEAIKLGLDAIKALNPRPIRPYPLPSPLHGTKPEAGV
jgi:DNA-directed RNA polymerase specialized sigma54-like protein